MIILAMTSVALLDYFTIVMSLFVVISSLFGEG